MNAFEKGVADPQRWLTHWFIQCGPDDFVDVSRPYSSFVEARRIAEDMDRAYPWCAPHKAIAARIAFQPEDVEQ